MPRLPRLLLALPRLLLVLVVAPALAATALVTGVSGPASAHEERPAVFPDGTGHRPGFLGYDNPRHRVVCLPGAPSGSQACPTGR